MKFLATDTETGGLDPTFHSLLTLHMRVLDEDFQALDQLSLALKHPTYKVTPKALEINKIDLVKHDQVAIPIPNAQVIMDNFVAAHSAKEKLIFMAHNVPFDKSFIWETFDTTVLKEALDYHSFDTVTLGVVEKRLGTLPKKQSLSLVNIADALGLEKGEAHTASGDVDTMVNYAKSFASRYLAALKNTR